MRASVRERARARARVCVCVRGRASAYALTVSFADGVIILPVCTVCGCYHSAGVNCVWVLSFCRCELCVGVIILPV